MKMKKLTKRQENALGHSEHHTRKHMTEMRKMRAGKNLHKKIKAECIKEVDQELKDKRKVLSL